PKAESAQRTLAALNPAIHITPIARVLDRAALREQAGLADVVVDCTDDLQTRLLVNEACVRTRTPLVSGAAIRLEGQLLVWRPDRPQSPCCRCLYPEPGEIHDTCTRSGVLGPVAGIIGSLQAVETVKLIVGMGETLTGRLLLLDAATLEWHEIAVRQDPACPVCA
ncbi:MAG: ThiF family adenylyltransferase, partial [Pseudomonadota bacterium]|nr:ThiF family adenylyltransferase [Pseudomonadota bacterium]